jgi:hypothetical protein
MLDGVGALAEPEEALVARRCEGRADGVDVTDAVAVDRGRIGDDAIAIARESAPSRRRRSASFVSTVAVMARESACDRGSARRAHPPRAGVKTDRPRRVGVAERVGSTTPPSASTNVTRHGSVATTARRHPHRRSCPLRERRVRRARSRRCRARRRHARRGQ